jgi:hypothetical protein
MALQPCFGPWPLCLSFSFVISFTHSVGLLGRVISPSQGRYLYTGRHKQRINTHTDIHALSGIRIHDPSVRANEDSACLRPRGHCDKEGIIHSTYANCADRFVLWSSFRHSKLFTVKKLKMMGFSVFEDRAEVEK